MSVEFLSDDEPPPAPPQHRRPRAWWVVLAVVVLAAAVVWALTRSSDRRPVAAGSTTPTAPSVQPEPLTPTHVDTACRRVPGCAVDTTVPRWFPLLARRYLPAGLDFQVHTVVSVSSLTQERLLVQRDIRGSGNSTVVLVSVRRGGNGEQAIAVDPPGIGSLVIHTERDGFLIRLQYLAPDAVAPDIHRLHEFISDPALVTAR